MKMVMLDYSQQAIANLMAAKIRTFLAILGILVGSATIVALISCSQLATDKALNQFKQLGTELIAVSVFEPEGRRSSPLSLKMWQALPKMVPDIKLLAAYNVAYQSVSFKGRHINNPVKSVIGADDLLAKIIHLQLARGRFITDIDPLSRVCVIGHTLATQLKTMNFHHLVGQQLRIGQSLYTIIGISVVKFCFFLRLNVDGNHCRTIGLKISPTILGFHYIDKTFGAINVNHLAAISLARSRKIDCN